MNAASPRLSRPSAPSSVDSAQEPQAASSSDTAGVAADTDSPTPHVVPTPILPAQHDPHTSLPSDRSTLPSLPQPSVHRSAALPPPFTRPTPRRAASAAVPHTAIFRTRPTDRGDGHPIGDDLSLSLNLSRQASAADAARAMSSPGISSLDRGSSRKSKRPLRSLFRRATTYSPSPSTAQSPAQSDNESEIAPYEASVQYDFLPLTPTYSNASAGGPSPTAQLLPPEIASSARRSSFVPPNAPAPPDAKPSVETTDFPYASLPPFKLSGTGVLQPLQDETPKMFYERAVTFAAAADVLTGLARHSDQFYVAALRAGMEQFNYAGDPLDMAMRKFFLNVALPNETQQIDRVLEAFAIRYAQCNADIFTSPDPPYILATSIMLLHTDHFNKNLKSKMTKADYVKNTSGIIQSMQINEMLEYVYDNVTCVPFVYSEQAKDKKRFMTKANPYALLSHDRYRELSEDFARLFTLHPTLRVDHDYATLDAGKLLHHFCQSPTIKTASYTGPAMAMSSPSALAVYTSVQAPQTEVISTVRVTKLDMLQGREESDSISVRKPVASNWSSSSSRTRRWGLLLTSGQLLIFKDASYADSLLRHLAKCAQDRKKAEEVLPNFAPDCLLHLYDAVAFCDGETDRVPNAFKVRSDNSRTGVQRLFFFVPSSAAERTDWMAKINFAATMRWAGVKKVDGVSKGELIALARMRRGSVATALSGLAVHRNSVVTTDSGGSKGSHGGRPSSSSAPRNSSMNMSDTMSETLSRWDSVRDGRLAELEARFEEKLREANALIEVGDESMDAYQRTARHLSILAPLQKSTKDRLMGAAISLANRLNQLYLDTFKAHIRRAILLCPLDHSPSTRRSSMAHVTNSYAFGASPPGDFNLAALQKQLNAFSFTPLSKPSVSASASASASAPVSASTSVSGSGHGSGLCFGLGPSAGFGSGFGPDAGSGSDQLISDRLTSEPERHEGRARASSVLTEPTRARRPRPSSASIAALPSMTSSFGSAMEPKSGSASGTGLGTGAHLATGPAPSSFGTTHSSAGSPLLPSPDLGRVHAPHLPVPASRSPVIVSESGSGLVHADDITKPAPTGIPLPPLSLQQDVVANANANADADDHNRIGLGLGFGPGPGPGPVHRMQQVHFAAHPTSMPMPAPPP